MLFPTRWVKSLPVFGCDTSRPIQDWLDWSDDSDVSCGGVRLDRRRELQYHVRTVCGYCTT